MTTRVLFDDKTLMSFVTPDRILHRFYPGIAHTAVPSYKVYHQQEATADVLLGQTEVIPTGAQVLFYEPCYVSERTISVMGGRRRHVFFLDSVTKILEYVKYTKFINIVEDDDTQQAIMHMWLNVNAGSKGAAGFAAAADSGEPFGETTGVTDTTMMRAIAFSRGHYYGVWDDKDGLPVAWTPTYIFEQPQVVEVVGVWNPDNEAEQVLDIHNELN